MPTADFPLQMRKMKPHGGAAEAPAAGKRRRGKTARAEPKQDGQDGQDGQEEQDEQDGQDVPFLCHATATAAEEERLFTRRALCP